MRAEQLVRLTAGATATRTWAYTALKTAVLSHQFHPGNRLTEMQVAGLLGISRTPVREALHRLAAEGLLVPRPRRGFMVPVASTAERDGLLELWSVYQGYVSRKVCDSRTPDLLCDLAFIINQAADAVTHRDMIAAARWHRRFHERVSACLADHARLKREIHSLEEPLRPYRRVAGEDPEPPSTGCRRTADSSLRWN